MSTFTSTVRTGPKVYVQIVACSCCHCKSLSKSFKVLSFMINTMLHPTGPAAQDRISILMCRDLSKNAICFKFKGVQVWKSDSTKVFLEPVKQPKITRGQIRAVGGVIKDSDVSAA